MASEGKFNIHAKGYPERLHGTELKYQQGDTAAEAIALGHFENEDALLRAAYGTFNIRASTPLKIRANEEGSTVQELTNILAGYKFMAERKQGGGGGNPEALAKARATREAQKAAASELELIKAAAAADPKIQAMLDKLRAAGAKIG